MERNELLLQQQEQHKLHQNVLDGIRDELSRLERNELLLQQQEQQLLQQNVIDQIRDELSRLERNELLLQQQEQQQLQQNVIDQIRDELSRLEQQQQQNQEDEFLSQMEHQEEDVNKIFNNSHKYQRRKTCYCSCRKESCSCSALKKWNSSGKKKWKLIIRTSLSKLNS